MLTQIRTSYKMNKPEVTIIIPNYMTPEMTRLCMRLLRKHTDLDRAKVIVVDNDSNDASLEYLRSLAWIKLIERHDIAGETASEMHARALDLALKEVDTPLVLVMHTDTLVSNDLWLDFLINRLLADDKIAGVGSWKLEKLTAGKKIGKKIEDFFRRLFGRKVKTEEKYLRSHCALYRTELIRAHTNGFFDGDTAGHSLHNMLVARGYEMQFIEAEELSKFLNHLNHATMILNPQLGGTRTSKPAARRRLQRQLDALDYRNILADDSLDRS